LAKATHAIDLHTAAAHRNNLPQVRANLDDPATVRLARAFGAPVVIDAKLRDGSLRAEAVERGLPVLLYEGGQAMRFDEDCIRVGVRGIRDVMRALDMLPKSKQRGRTHEPVAVQQTSWVRAP